MVAVFTKTGPQPDLGQRGHCFHRRGREGVGNQDGGGKKSRTESVTEMYLGREGRRRPFHVWRLDSRNVLKPPMYRVGN
ncbi:hypothetical protein GW17_00055877 [Ensete ventricosum]|nr:hypothetical protein GW17_00055877 [Ensete ventricosum]